MCGRVGFQIFLIFLNHLGANLNNVWVVEKMLLNIQSTYLVATTFNDIHWSSTYDAKSAIFIHSWVTGSKPT